MNFQSFPDSFVIKPVSGHSSNDVLLIRAGVDLFTGVVFTTESLKAHLVKLLESEPNTEILIEELIFDSNASYSIPRDFKFYTFNGEIEIIQVNSWQGNQKWLSFYNENWKPVQSIIEGELQGEITPPPTNFLKMKAQVTTLSKAYESFVRLDFYDSIQGPVFGEFTPTPRGGNNFTRAGSMRLVCAWEKNCKGLI